MELESEWIRRLVVKPLEYQVIVVLGQGVEEFRSEASWPTAHQRTRNTCRGGSLFHSVG